MALAEAQLYNLPIGDDDVCDDVKDVEMYFISENNEVEKLDVKQRGRMRKLIEYIWTVMD